MTQHEYRISTNGEQAMGILPGLDELTMKATANGNLPFARRADDHTRGESVASAPQVESNQETVQVTSRQKSAITQPPRLEQPLLLVACGGSGGLIATQLKAVLLETFGEMPENVALLYFDSADDPISCREQRLGKVVELERGSEFVRLKRVPVAGLKRNLPRNPEILERFGESIHRIHRPIIDDGAAMERPQGLLSVVWNASKIERSISHALRRLTQRNTNLDQRLSGDSRVNVIIAGSTAGGQGSGAIFDLTYIVREKLTELSDLAESSSVVGMFVLPGAFVEVKGPNLLPNTHAFFVELDSLMQGRGFIARYPGGLTINSKERPFDYVFVLDGVDEQGKTWPNREEVCTLGARTLALLFSTEVGMREINNLVNESGVLTRTSSAGFGSYLATAGQAVIRFPTAQVAERCSLRHAQAMIESLLATVNGKSARDSAASQGDRPEVSSAIAHNSVRDHLINRPNGSPLQAQLSAPTGLEQGTPEEIPPQARNLFANYLQRRLYDEDFSLLQEQAEALKRKLHQERTERLTSLTSIGRLHPIRAWLESLEQTGSHQLTLVVDRQERLARSVDLAQRNLEGASAAMDRAAESFILLRRGQVRTALGAYLAAANEVAQLRLEQRIELLVGDILRHDLSWAQQQLRNLTTLIGRLQQARTWLTSYEQELAGRTGGRSEISLAAGAFGIELVEHFYRLYSGNAATDIQIAIAQQGDLLDWVKWTPEEVALRLRQSVDHHFAPILQITVEDVLALRWHDRSAQQWIARLQGLAAGAWNLDQALLTSGGVELANFLTLGVPDESISSFANSGYTLVSTHDAERIIALRTVYGASLDTLKAMPLWKRIYEQARSQTLLHILNQFQTGGEDTSQLFALGLVFGHIYSQTSWFYYRTEDRLDEPLRLGQGLENAFTMFQQRPTLQEEVSRRVEGQVARDGSEKSIERIECWIEAGSNKQNGDELAKKLRRGARAYADQLRQANGATGGAV